MQEKQVKDLLNELIEVARWREFYETHGTHADGKQEFYDAEIKRVRNEVTARVRTLLARSRKIAEERETASAY